MRKELKNLTADRVHKYGILLSIFFIVFGMITFFLKVLSLPDLIPIFYNRPWGVSQLGTPRELFAVLTASIAIFLINLTLSLAVYKKVALLSRILLWISTLVSFLAAITVIRVLLLIA